MKKLMKAIAFATVMCMLLSTVAFASATLTSTDYVLAVTVNAGPSEQVALLIVDTAADLADLQDGDVLYAGQMASDGKGVADFGKITINSEAGSSQVDVYAGYASNDTGAAYTVASNVDLESVKAITVSIDGEKYIDDEIMGADQDAVGAAVAMDVSFENVTDNLSLTKLIFAIQTANGRKYTDAINAKEYGWDVLDGGIKIAAAINNGTGGQKIATITDVDAIFLFEDAQDSKKNQEVFTNDEDKKPSQAN